MNLEQRLEWMRLDALREASDNPLVRQYYALRLWWFEWRHR
jgi:hypothetical protein